MTPIYYMPFADLVQHALHVYEAAGRPSMRPWANKTRHSDPDLVRMSSLDTCPRKAAYDKMRLPPTDSAMDTKKLFISGEYGGFIYQEAFTYLATTTPYLSTECEVDLGLKTAPAYGRADMVLTRLVWDVWTDRFVTVKVVVEIKTGEGLIKRSIAEPKLGHALQLMAYRIALEEQGDGCAVESYLITDSRWRTCTWELFRVDDYYCIYDEHGNKFKPVGYNWNNAADLSAARLSREILVRRETHQSIRDGTAADEPLYPLNHEENYRCLAVDKGSTRGKKRPASAKPSCEFASKCWGSGAFPMPLIREDHKGENGKTSTTYSLPDAAERDALRAQLVGDAEDEL